jgi:hypothetical protein
MFGGMDRVGPLHPTDRNCLRGHLRDSEKSAYFILHPGELVSLSHVIPMILVS